MADGTQGTQEGFGLVGQPNYGHSSRFAPTLFHLPFNVYWNESQQPRVPVQDTLPNAPSYVHDHVPSLSHQHPPAPTLLHPIPYQQLHVDPSVCIQTPLVHPHVQVPLPPLTQPQHHQLPPLTQPQHYQYSPSLISQYSDTTMNSDSTLIDLFPDLSGLSSTAPPPDLTSPPPASAPPLCSAVMGAAGESDPHCLKPNPEPDVAAQTVPESKPGHMVSFHPNCSRCDTHRKLSEAECYYIPNRTPNPGQYGFRAKFVESQDARTRGNIWAYLEELNTLVVQPKCDFPVTFTMDKPLPPNCHVRAVMCFKHTSDVQRYGPVTRCIDHLEKDKMLEHHEHFIVSKTAGTTYSSQSSYNSVTVPVTSMPVVESGSFAVYCCNCFSSCRFNGKPAPPMVVVFSLINVGVPHMSLGRDVVNIRVCASPSRDVRAVIRKARERRLQEEAGLHLPLATPPASKRRRVEQCPKEDDKVQVRPPLDFVEDQPDEEGYYTFTWRLKDKVVYNLLQMMKKGSEVANLG